VVPLETFGGQGSLSGPAPVENSGACSTVRTALCSARMVPGGRDPGGPGVRDDLQQACGVSHRSVRAEKHTTPALPPLGLATALRTYDAPNAVEPR